MPELLPIDEAVGLVAGLVGALPPVSDWNPSHQFTVVARRRVGEPLAVDCLGFRLRLNLNMTWGNPAFMGQIHELLDVLAWLGVVPRCSVTEAPELWGRIVEVVVGESKVSRACLRFGGDPRAFPHWILAFTGEFGDERDPNCCSRAGTYDRDRRFVQELLARAPPSSENGASEGYVRAMARIRPLVEAAGREPREIPIGIDLDCGFCSQRARYFEDMRAYVRGLRASAASSSSRLRFASFGLTMGDRSTSLEIMRELSELDVLLLENSDLWFPRIVMNPPPLEYGTYSAVPDQIPILGPARHNYGTMLGHLLRGVQSGGQLDCVRLESYLGPWQASVVCAALRTTPKSIDHFIVHGTHGIPFADLYWLAYGLFHRSSRARVRLVELSFCETSWGMGDVNEVLASDRPGSILVAEMLDWTERANFEYPLVGTWARLKHRNFTLRVDYLYSSPEPRTTEVTCTDEPEFEVLAVSESWVGILVPSQGFGFIKRDVVERIWTEEIPTTQTHGVQDLIVNSRGFKQVPQLLRAMGGSLQSLALRSTEFTTYIEEEDIDEIIRACPNVTTLEICSFKLDPLVRAYEEGRCKVSSLVVQNAFQEGPDAIASFLAMLEDRDHVGAATLQQLAFDFRSYQNYNANALPTEVAGGIITQIMQRSAKLRVFFLVESWSFGEVDVGRQYGVNDWQKTHPMIALQSVRTGPVGDSIGRLDQDFWRNVVSFLGPNRTIRVVPLPSLS